MPVIHQREIRKAHSLVGSRVAGGRGIPVAGQRTTQIRAARLFAVFMLLHVPAQPLRDTTGRVDCCLQGPEGSDLGLDPSASPLLDCQPEGKESHSVMIDADCASPRAARDLSHTRANMPC